jgi:hypothetical protein
MTILSAQYANQSNTVAAALTDNRGEVLVSQVDAPEAWEALHLLTTPTAYVEPVAPVPETITPLQARKAIRAAGLKPVVDQYVASLSEEQREEWEYCIEVRRHNGLVSEALTLLGYSEAQKDDIFRLGATFI